MSMSVLQASFQKAAIAVTISSMAAARCWSVQFVMPLQISKRKLGPEQIVSLLSMTVNELGDVLRPMCSFIASLAICGSLSQKKSFRLFGAITASLSNIILE